jgi:hypothetical protein
MRKAMVTIVATVVATDIVRSPVGMIAPSKFFPKTMRPVADPRPERRKQDLPVARFSGPKSVRWMRQLSCGISRIQPRMDSMSGLAGMAVEFLFSIHKNPHP